MGDYKELFEQEVEKNRTLQLELKSLKEEIDTKQDAIEKFNHHLTDMLESQVREKTEELTASYQAKSLFLATMSHEIRTPLTSILGYAENLRENLKLDPNKEIIEYILKNGNHLLEIINDVLDFSKLEQKQLNIENISFNLPRMLEEIHSILEIQSSKKDLKLDVLYRYPIPSFLYSDITRVKQVLINLCSNAIKFTEDGSVIIKVYFEEPNVVFEVVDSGIGISENKISTLFDPFTQADLSTTRKYGGTGLGLTISKKLAGLLNGDLEVTSVLGKGSTFKFFIKQDIDENNLIKDKSELDKVLNEKVENRFNIPKLAGDVLVVDDYPDNLNLFKLFIDRTGAKVEFAEDGEQAVEKALSKDYNLILMDIRMPKMDGHEAIKVLRASGCMIPAIALTANVMKEEINMYLEAGFDEFLQKPIVKENFYKNLAKYLPKREGNVSSSEEVEDSDEFQKLVEEFKSSLPERISKMQMARVDDNWPEVRKLAHAIKGMGGAFGFPKLTEVAKNLELSIKDNNLHEADIFYDEICEMVDGIIRGKV